jgi:hypothetical protein
VTYWVKGNLFWHLLHVEVTHINPHAKWVDLRFTGFTK